MEDTITRFKVESNEKWRDWIKKIPAIKFPSEWKIKIIPPFGGAMIRFIVIYNSLSISVYLDCYDVLGIFGKPYWEIHPYNNDVYRIEMNNTDELIERIKEVIDGKDAEYK